MVTQKEIAARLGVSRQLVGFALGDHPAIADETRRRVREAAQGMGYNSHSNGAARSLAAKRNGKRARTGVLALLIPYSLSSARESAYFAPLIEGIECEAKERDLELCFFTLSGSGPLPRLLMNGSTDGVIAMQWDGELASNLAEHDVPLVWLTLQDEGGACVLPDERKGAKLAARHLLKLKHRRIGYIGYAPFFPSAQQRLAGFRDVLENADCFDETLLEYSGLEDAAEAARRLLKRAPDVSAIFCYNDFMAMDVVRELQSQGKKVPRDVSVVGFDDTAHEPDFLPALTSVAYDRVAMGRRAAALLIEQIGKDGGHSAPVETLPVTLSVRASSANRKK